MSSRAQSRQTIESVRQFIEQGIRNGEWPSGSQLPTERALAEEFGAARNAVRRALALLEESRQVVRMVGRGTFVADDPSIAIAQPQRDSRTTSPEEIMEVRLMIEPMIASLVVARATQQELEKLEKIVKNGNDAKDMATFEYWDGKLHNAIARLTKNQYLIELMERMHAVRCGTTWGQLKRRGESAKRRATYQAELDAIVSALVDRNAERAEAAIKAHLRQVRWNLFGR